tara:strand:+ start:506 stop:793 length:288 start_codon:yes stop_codon:yes gene_type:complete
MNRLSIKKFFKDSTTIVIVFIFIFISFLAINYRMKSVELDYVFGEESKNKKMASLKLKRLKAERAKELSINNLNKLAKKLKMKEPSQKQIIVVPE